MGPRSKPLMRILFQALVCWRLVPSRSKYAASALSEYRRKINSDRDALLS